MHPPICQTQYEVGEILEMIGISTVIEEGNHKLTSKTMNTHCNWEKSSIYFIILKYD